MNQVFMHKKCVPNSNPLVETGWFRNCFSCVCQFYFVVKFIIRLEDLGPECVVFRVSICHSRSIALFVLNEWIFHQCYIFPLMISIYEFSKLQSRNKRFQMWKTQASFLYAFMKCFLLILSSTLNLGGFHSIPRCCNYVTTRSNCASLSCIHIQTGFCSKITSTSFQSVNTLSSLSIRLAIYLLIQCRFYKLPKQLVTFSPCAFLIPFALERNSAP